MENNKVNAVAEEENKVEETNVNEVDETAELPAEKESKLNKLKRAGITALKIAAGAALVIGAMAGAYIVGTKNGGNTDEDETEEVNDNVIPFPEQEAQAV